MEAFEVSLTRRKLERTTGGEVWAVGSMRNHFHTMRGQEMSSILRYMWSCVNRDGTSIDHYDNVVTDMGCAPY